MRKSKQLCAVLALMLSGPAWSGGYTGWVVPDFIERIGSGFVVHGNFADINSCGNADYIYYPNTNADYELVATMVLTALASGRELQFYTNSCAYLSFHGITVNQSYNGNGVFLR